VTGVICGTPEAANNPDRPARDSWLQARWVVTWDTWLWRLLIAGALAAVGWLLFTQRPPAASFAAGAGAHAPRAAVQAQLTAFSGCPTKIATQQSTTQQINMQPAEGSSAFCDFQGSTPSMASGNWEDTYNIEPSGASIPVVYPVSSLDGSPGALVGVWPPNKPAELPPWGPDTPVVAVSNPPLPGNTWVPCASVYNDLPSYDKCPAVVESDGTVTDTDVFLSIQYIGSTTDLTDAQSLPAYYFNTKTDEWHHFLFMYIPSFNPTAFASNTGYHNICPSPSPSQSPYGAVVVWTHSLTDVGCFPVASVTDAIQFNDVYYSFQMITIPTELQSKNGCTNGWDVNPNAPLPGTSAGLITTTPDGPTYGCVDATTVVFGNGAWYTDSSLANGWSLTMYGPDCNTSGSVSSFLTISMAGGPDKACNWGLESPVSAMNANYGLSYMEYEIEGTSYVTSAPWAVGAFSSYYLSYCAGTQTPGVWENVFNGTWLPGSGNLDQGCLTSNNGTSVVEAGVSAASGLNIYTCGDTSALTTYTNPTGSTGAASDDVDNSTPSSVVANAITWSNAPNGCVQFGLSALPSSAYQSTPHNAVLLAGEDPNVQDDANVEVEVDPTLAGATVTCDGITYFTSTVTCLLGVGDATINATYYTPANKTTVLPGNDAELFSGGSSSVGSITSADPATFSVAPPSAAGTVSYNVAVLDTYGPYVLAGAPTISIDWASVSVSLRASCTSCSYNQASTLSATATVNGSEFIPSDGSIVIEETSPSSSTVASTTSSDPESTSVGPYAGSTYDYVAYLEDAYGYPLAQPSTVAVTWASAPAYGTSYSVSLSASCTPCSYGQASTLSAAATVNGSESIPSGDSIVIEETSPSSSTVASTTSSDPESTSVGPYAGSTYDYVAYLENGSCNPGSASCTLAQSSTVAVTWGSPPPPTTSYSISLNASCTSCSYNQASTLSATVTVNGSESVPSGDSIVIEETSPGSSAVASGSSDPESASVGPYAGSTYDYVAYLENGSCNPGSASCTLAQSSPVAVTWGSAPASAPPVPEV